MSIPYPVRRPRDGDPLAATGHVLVACVSAVTFGVVLALGLYRNPLSLSAVLTVGFGLIAITALALARYDVAVGLGILILGVVELEPAPTDAVLSVAIAVALVTGRFSIWRVPSVVTGLVGVFLALNVLSAAAVVDPSRAVRYSIVTLYLAVFGLWLAGYLHSSQQGRVIAGAYVAGAVVWSVLSSLALFVPYPGSELFIAEGLDRAQGLFKDPNVYGHFLVPAALLLIEESLSPRLLRSGRLLKSAMLLAVLAGILFSYSRAAWASCGLGVLVMIVVFAMRRGGGRKVALLLGIAVTAATVLISAIAVTGSVGFLQERARVQGYDVNRFGAQQEGIRLVEQHPFGIGPGQFEEASYVSAHSLYVRSLAEQGVLGLATVLALVLVTLLMAAYNAVVGRDTYGVGSATLLAAWMGILVSGLVIDTLHWRHFWLVAALIWAGFMRPREPPERPRYASSRTGVPA